MCHIFAIPELRASSLVVLYSLAASRQSGLSVPLCPISANNAIFGTMVAMQHPIVAIHELCASSLVALLSLAATRQSGLSVPLSRLCT